MNKEDSKKILKNVDFNIPDREVSSIEIKTDDAISTTNNIGKIAVVGDGNKNLTTFKELIRNKDLSDLPPIENPIPNFATEYNPINIESAMPINSDEFSYTAPFSKEILMTDPPQYNFDNRLEQDDVITLSYKIYDAIVSDDIEYYEKMIRYNYISDKMSKYLFSHLQLAVLNTSREIIDHIIYTINNNYSSLKKKPAIYIVRPPYDEEHIKEYHAFTMTLRALKEGNFHVIVTEKVEEV